MVKIVFLVHKRADLDREEFRRYWRETHGPIAAKLPGLRKYVQNHALPGPDGFDPEYDGLTELWFDDLESFERVASRRASRRERDIPERSGSRSEPIERSTSHGG